MHTFVLFAFFAVQQEVSEDGSMIGRRKREPLNMQFTKVTLAFKVCFRRSGKVGERTKMAITPCFSP